jgi:hypothetical protein
VKLTFANWLALSQRGDRFQYYRGFLLRFDREMTTPPADCCAAWAAYKTGRVTLVQKRMGENDYIYFAMRL